MSERSLAAESDEIQQDKDQSQDQRLRTVKIGDREVSQEELIATYQTRENWQASMTQQQQAFGEIVKGMSAAAATAREAPRREVESDRPAPRVEVADLEEEIDALTNGLPDPAEHPAEFKAGFNAGLKKLLPRYRQSVVDEVEARLEAKQAKVTQQLREETERTVQGSVVTQGVVSQNVRLLDEVLDEAFPGHTTAQRTAVAEELKALQGNTKYGEVVQCADGNRVIRYNRTAVLQAAKMADLKPSSRPRSAQPQNRSEEPEELGPPPLRSAPAKAHIDWLRRAATAGGEEAAAAQEYFHSLPLKKRQEIHSAYASG